MLIIVPHVFVKNNRFFLNSSELFILIKGCFFQCKLKLLHQKVDFLLTLFYLSLQKVPIIEGALLLQCAVIGGNRTVS